MGTVPDVVRVIRTYPHARAAPAIFHIKTVAVVAVRLDVPKGESDEVVTEILFAGSWGMTVDDEAGDLAAVLGFGGI